MQTQETIAKNFFRLKQSKLKEIKSVRANAAKFSKLAKKKDKQKMFKRRRKCIRESKETLVTSNNAINSSKKILRKKCNINKVTCFNYNKKSYYVNNWTKLKN